MIKYSALRESRAHAGCNDYFQQSAPEDNAAVMPIRADGRKDRVPSDAHPAKP